jgi:hypothetical protein
MRLVLGEQHAKKVYHISLSNCFMKERSSELNKDILGQVIAEIQFSPYFALQLDESAHVDSCEQLLMYTQYIKKVTL